MTGWRRVCEVMARAGVRGPQASPKGFTPWVWCGSGHRGRSPQSRAEVVGTCAALHDRHLCGCGGRGRTCHCGADVAWAGRAPLRATRTAWIRAAHARTCPAWALPCPLKPRTSARVLTNTDLRKAGVGEPVWREKPMALRWRASGSPPKRAPSSLAQTSAAPSRCPAWGSRERPMIIGDLRAGAEPPRPHRPRKAGYALRRSPSIVVVSRATRTRVADHQSSSASIHSAQKCYRAVSALLLRMLREGKMRSTFRNIQDGSLSA